MRHFLEKVLRHPRAMIIVWCIIIPFVFVKHNFLSTFSNNYKVFKYAYVHAASGETLYGRYPQQYDDKNNYGPFFSFFFAPYALLPDWAGHLLWVATIIALLIWSVRWLPLTTWQRNGIMLVCLNEILTSALHVQFNIVVAASIVLTFVLIYRKKEFWAPLPILLTAFVKLYGVVGFAFFFLVKNKPKFIAGCIVWALVLFAAPMLISSPEYVMAMYKEWYYNLIVKNSENVSLVTYQDISVMGFFRRLFQDPTIPNTPFLVVGIFLFALPYLRIKQYKDKAYQLLLLASTLIFPIIFSSSSESSTYIIVFIGIAIWFVIQPRPFDGYVWALLAFSILLGSFNTADFYPRELRTFLREHSVKALPCAIIWLRIIYEMMTRAFSTYSVQQNEETPGRSVTQDA